MGDLKLSDVFRKLKEKHEEEWKSVEEEFIEKVDEIRNFVIEKVKRGALFTEEDAEKILNLSKNVPEGSKFLLRFIGSVGGDKKQVIVNLLSNEYFSKLIEALENEKHEDIKAMVEKIIQSTYNVKYTTLTTWLAIFKPDLFMPVWGFEKEMGTLPQSLLKRFDELNKFRKWWDLRVNKFFDLLQILRTTANSVGVENMFEMAFYLNKYLEDKLNDSNTTKRFWLIAPGVGAEYWNTCVNRGIICVGWRKAVEKLGKEIFEIEDEESFKKRVRNEFNYGDSHELWKFLKEISEGDIVFSKRGMKEIIGIGIVESEPSIDLEMKYPIYRKVKWYKIDLSLESPKQFSGAVAELRREEIEENSELKKLIDSVICEIQKDLEISLILESKKQIILYGPPGTGKTRLARNYIEIRTNRNRKFYEFVTFHPSYSYEEFIEGLRPIPAENGVKYVVEDGIFKRMAIRAMCEAIRWQNLDLNLAKSAEKLLKLLNEIESGKIERYDEYYDKYNEAKRELWQYLEMCDKEKVKKFFKNAQPFYILIDEINRGDISKIFGELITLLEADKRLFAENELTVILPYSKTKFGIPPNLYIIGTMNTADRSIALIDIALRRRFGFIELMPDYDVLRRKLIKEGDEAKDIKELAIKVLHALNEKIRKLYDRDHQIGHSYFIKLEDCKSKDDAIEMLKQIWFYEVIPLLQEYFYDSPEKLSEILKDFVSVSDDSYDFKKIDDFTDEEFEDILRKIAGESSGQ
ncbi:MAG: hypothetical protein DSY33_05345 [Archaeoglobus sp.]|nr:MAG: hypothetical protein DSY33_05345 [Archaeoglobus sp.]